MYMCLCTMYRYPWMSEDSTGAGAGVTGSCELSEMGAENWTRILQRSSQCSDLLCHLPGLLKLCEGFSEQTAIGSVKSLHSLCGTFPRKSSSKFFQSWILDIGIWMAIKCLPAVPLRRPGCWTAGWILLPSCRYHMGWSRCFFSAESQSRWSWCRCIAWLCQMNTRRLGEKGAFFKNHRNTKNLGS